MISNLIQKICNYEYKAVKPQHLTAVFVIILIVSILYPMLEVLYTMQPDFTIFSYFSVVNGAANVPKGSAWLQPIFLELWLLGAVFCIGFRCCIIIWGYFSNRKMFGDEIFAKDFVLYLSSFLIGMLGAVLILLAIAGIGVLIGFPFSAGMDFFGATALQIQTWINSVVPVIYSFDSIWVALILSILISNLGGYFVHWLCHYSRFFWYVFHRCHHTPETLHPLAAPPAYFLEFFMVIPATIATAAFSRLFYTDALVMELSLWFLFGYCMEIFNHSASLYKIAYNNPIIRNWCRLAGDKGVYHLVHHSAKEEDQMVNLAGGPFNFWDRVFGTYRKPYPELPPLGLTNTPEIIYNPFRVMYSGLWQIFYELRMNKGLWTKFKIVFGTVYYQPPISKEFLIVGYENKRKQS